MTRVALKVEGLKPWRAAVEGLGDDVKKELPGLYDDMADLIVAEARPLVPRRSGRLAASLRAVSGGVLFGSGVPYAGWIEFGGAIGRQQANRRRYVRAGRHLYPAIGRRWAAIIEAQEATLDRATQRAGLR